MSRSSRIEAEPRRQEFGRRRDLHTIIIAHGERERHFAIKPWVALSVASVAVLFGFAYLGATAYLMYRDDIIGGAIARHARLQYAYEDRLAALRSQIDKINSRQLIDQAGLEARVADLIRRQDVLKSQSTRVAALLDRASERDARPASLSSGTPPIPMPTEAPVRALGFAPEAPATTGTVRPMPLEAPKPDGLRPLSRLDADGAQRTVAAVETDLQRLSTHHVVALDRVVRAAETQIDRFERVAARLRVALPATAPVAAGSGGPLVALDARDLGPHIARAEGALQRLERVEKAFLSVPLAVPLRGEAVVTSSFGPRRDPFLGIDAMHTGIDYRAETGVPILATGAGRVVKAEREGGYGLMVEIDHGQGLSTRFGHMSRIDVEVGDAVLAGDVVGRVGSTGRSTGPHLHYETRVFGEAVNPWTYLQAGRELRGEP